MQAPPPPRPPLPNLTLVPVSFTRSFALSAAVFVLFCTAIGQVTARRLLWDSQDREGSGAALLAASGGAGYDLIIASDCLFFKARNAAYE